MLREKFLVEELLKTEIPRAAASQHTLSTFHLAPSLPTQRRVLRHCCENVEQ